MRNTFNSSRDFNILLKETFTNMSILSSSVEAKEGIKTMLCLCLKGRQVSYDRKQDATGAIKKFEYNYYDLALVNYS
jgi:hypothetical protein